MHKKDLLAMTFDLLHVEKGIVRMHGWTEEGLSCRTHAHLAGVGLKVWPSTLKLATGGVMRNSSIMVVETLKCSAKVKRLK